MPGLTAYYVVYPANLSSPTESNILAGWPGNAVASGSFSAIDGLNEYTIPGLDINTDYKIAVIIQEDVKSNVLITPFSTTDLLAYYVVYPENLSDPSDSQIINGWPGFATASGFFSVQEGLNNKDITGISGNNLKVALIVVDGVLSNSLVASFLLSGLTTYYVCYSLEVGDPTVNQIVTGWPGVAIKAGSFSTIEDYNNFTITALSPSTSYKVALVTVGGTDVSNDLSILITTVSDVQRRSTRLPRMLLTFPRFRRYS